MHDLMPTVRVKPSNFEAIPMTPNRELPKRRRSQPSQWWVAAPVAEDDPPQDGPSRSKQGGSSDMEYPDGSFQDAPVGGSLAKSTKSKPASEATVLKRRGRSSKAKVELEAAAVSLADHRSTLKKRGQPLNKERGVQDTTSSSTRNQALRRRSDRHINTEKRDGAVSLAQHFKPGNRRWPSNAEKSTPPSLYPSRKPGSNTEHRSNTKVVKHNREEAESKWHDRSTQLRSHSDFNL